MLVLRFLAASAALVASLTVSTASAGDPSVSGNSLLGGKWRITRTVIAPWADEESAGVAPAWIGSSVAFGEKSVKGPRPLSCRQAAYEGNEVPPDEMFQGNLPEPATAALAQLGVADGPARGVSLSCSTGVFEFHWASKNSLLAAIDNRIWTFDRTEGTRAAKNSPEGVLQRFLESHFAGDMAFTPQTVASKRAYLTKALVEKIDLWFKTPQAPDEAPEINGDPFTDSQEYPARFAVGADNEAAEGVETPVEFASAYSKRTAVFIMAREKGRWRIDDIRYEDGSLFSEMLAGG